MSKIVDVELESVLKKIQDKKDIFGAEVKKMAPAGYLPISLSSEGNFGVPKTIFIKNFTTEDALALAMAQEELLPEYLIPILNSNIWNPDEDINVSTWTEKQVIELLLKLYANFYSPVITDIVFPLEKSDFELLELPEYAPIRKRYEAGWKPKIDIDIRKLSFFDMTDIKINERIRIKNKKNGLNVVFSIPRFGDFIVLKKNLKEYFFESDRKFRIIGQKIENNDLSITLEDTIELEQYYLKKAMYTTKITKAFYIVEFDGIDISEYSLSQKMEVATDARLDKNVFKQYEKELGKFQYGVDENVQNLVHPFTNKVCTRRFTFRLYDILQDLFISNNDDYDITYD